MARLLLKGKSSLLGTKKRGGPKPRGEIMKVNGITEGMVASFAVMVSLNINRIGSIGNANNNNFFVGTLLTQS